MGGARLPLPFARRLLGTGCAFALAMSLGTPFSTSGAKERAHVECGDGRVERRSGVTSSPACSWSRRPPPKRCQPLLTASFAFSASSTSPSRSLVEHWPVPMRKRRSQSGSGHGMPMNRGSRCCANGLAARRQRCANGDGRPWLRGHWPTENPRGCSPAFRDPRDNSWQPLAVGGGGVRSSSSLDSDAAVKLRPLIGFGAQEFADQLACISTQVFEGQAGCAVNDRVSLRILQQLVDVLLR